MNGWTMETKHLRLRTPVELGSRFDDWQVCWLGGWSKHRLDYLVMLVKVPFADRPVPSQDTGRKKPKQKTPPGGYPAARRGRDRRGQSSTE
jgi:hypothetical protein